MTQSDGAPGRLTCIEDLEAACLELARRVPVFAQALAQTGVPPLRLRPEGFAALLRLILEQQISVAAAEGIWRRMDALTTPQDILAADDEALRAVGLSRPKIRYARALAESVADGSLNLENVALAPDEEAIQALTSVKGIGRWTAECYLLFSLGRADLSPAADLALQEGARLLFDLEARPTAAELTNMAAAWSPHRGAAARILWAYVRAQRKSAAPGRA